jgi:NAD(P)-dependent dehydrogenase (short-subunit alcohol dehydrogenase family)
MDGLLQNKVAIITGAGSGVGRAACLIFARHGARVVAADIDAGAADGTVTMVQEQGGEAIAQGCDVSDQGAVTALVQQAVAVFGRLDIMYNNAGITVRPKPGAGLQLRRQRAG